ncbi:calpain-2 catalytic subunit isoform X2 [Microcaecilia unicolor]|uniref:Calpain-2 catalytic subunit-like isoform X2 n=1 Tax=Microcaecilia unicolor TaxID=1415580 RepID=A0A6P7Z366_9AMPH|nr:calpain-2 catalytic subunit-like isoform X2 [Microcaecilia unicolor]
MANTLAEPGSRENPLKYRNQDYESLRSACLREKKLFEDPEFPASPQSVGVTQDKTIIWLRPKSISKSPQFILQSADTTDICQGELGNCWVLAAVSCLTLQSDLFSYVVPDGQNFQKYYAGIFHFRFWQFGKWIEVVVDDWLPTRHNQLIFTCSTSKDEFWSALLEKAYAKLNNSYACLKSGIISEAMEDFTGGIAESIEVSSISPKALWGLVNKLLSKTSLLSCFIKVSNRADIGKKNKVEMVMGHAYALIGTKIVKKGATNVLLFRLRNPWGFVEYNGPWSDKSPEWDTFSKKDRNRLKLELKEDGEFWISCDEFSKFFTVIEVCSLNPDSLDDDNSSWGITSHEGSWIAGYNAGGGKNMKTFFTNPQFQLRLQEEDDKYEDGEISCTVVVELLQKNRRKHGVVDFLYIAFQIYRVPFQAESSRLKRSFFVQNNPVADTGLHCNNRAVTKRISLPPGDYVIIPSTHKPNLVGDFFLRIFAKKKNKFRQQDNFPSIYNYIQPVTSAAPGFQSHIRDIFNQHAGGDNEMNSLEFQSFINSVLPERHHLSLETCRTLVFGIKCRHLGKLELLEAEELVAWIQNLKDIYERFSTSPTDPMSSFELPLALQEAGFQLSGQVHEQLWLCCRTDDQTLTCSDFVHCVARLRKLFELYTMDTQDIPETKRRDINEWLLLFLTI